MLLIPAAVVLILLLGLGLLHTPPVQRFAFERLRTLLLDKSAIDIQASGFRFSLFGREITLEDLRVRSTSAPDLPPLFQAERISVKFNVRNIVKGSWDLEELQITAPKIHFYVGPDGQSNLPRTGSRSGGTPDYLIARGEIRDGSFRYEDVRKEVALELPRWQLLLDGKRPDREHRIAFSSLQRSSFKYRTYTIPIDQLRLSGTLHQTSLRIEAADLGAANSQLSLKGSISDFSSPVSQPAIQSTTGFGCDRASRTF